MTRAVTNMLVSNQRGENYNPAKRPWLGLLLQYRFSYALILALGFFILPLSLITLLLISYCFNQINAGTEASQSVLSWNDILGSHMAQWLTPYAANTAFEKGVPFEFQQAWFPTMLGACAIILALAKFFQEYLLEKLGEQIALNLRCKIAETYSTLSFKQTQGVEGALLAQIVGDDTKEVRLSFTRLWGSVPTDLLQCLLFATFLILLDTNLFSLLLAITIPAAIVIRTTGVTLKKLARQGLKSQTELLESMLEKLHGWQSIQVLCGIPRELQSFQSTNNRLLNIWRRATRAKALGAPLVEWLGIGAAAFVLVLALRRVSEGELSSQVLTSFVVVIAQFSNAAQSIAQQLNASRKGTEALRRILATAHNWEQRGIDVEPNSQRPVNCANAGLDQSIGNPAAKAYEKSQICSIELRNLAIAESHTSGLAHEKSQKTFNLPESAQQELNKKILAADLNIHAQIGDLVIIQGPSGSGKSTLIRVLLGLEKPQSGFVLWNGQELTQKFKSAHSHDIAFLPQEPFIIEGSTLENVAYPNLLENSPTQEILTKAKESLRKANLSDKDLFASPRNFSGGEKQRLMFARAFFRHATVWMIDEATSALDASNEADILNILKENTKEHIIFMVAHRQTVKNFGTKHISLHNSE